MQRFNVHLEADTSQLSLNTLFQNNELNNKWKQMKVEQSKSEK